MQKKKKKIKKSRKKKRTREGSFFYRLVSKPIYYISHVSVHYEHSWIHFHVFRIISDSSYGYYKFMEDLAEIRNGAVDWKQKGDIPRITEFLLFTALLINSDSKYNMQIGIQWDFENLPLGKRLGLDQFEKRLREVLQINGFR